MNSDQPRDDQLIYIREMLCDLSQIANAEGYRMLSHLIGMACLEAWEMERKLIGICEQEEEEELEEESCRSRH